MACGVHQPNHSTGTTTCTNHRPPYSPDHGPDVFVPVKGDIVTAAKINELRSAIVTEVARWQQHAHYTNVTANAFFPALYTPVAKGVTVVSSGNPTEEVDNALLAVEGAGSPGATVFPNPSANPGAATVANDADINAVLHSGSAPDVIPDVTFFKGFYITTLDYNALVSNYNALRTDCICNSDCGCNAVCACHGDCGCNYSDKRLKMEIQYC